MPVVLATTPYLQFFDDNGDPLAGGLVYTYAAGTTTPKAAYTDASGLVPISNPIVLDSSGRGVWFIDGSYRYVVQTSTGSPVRTVDNITSFGIAGGLSAIGSIDPYTIVGNNTGASIVPLALTPAQTQVMLGINQGGNRLINGDQRIDQRNAGAAVSVTSNGVFATDRWQGNINGTPSGVFSMRRLTSSPPAGFSHFLRMTTTTADASIGSTEAYSIRQVIEGNNFSDFAFGTASASNTVLSFWVRCSLTGTFSGSLQEALGTRSYPFTFQINAANTWEYKTISAPGDQSGTWATDSSGSLAVVLDIGSGSSFKGPASAWAAANYWGATGASNLIATLNATMDITGVQLEKGAVATSFERRSFGEELALCLRYFQSVNDSGIPFAQFGVGYTSSSSTGAGPYLFSAMRSSPTVSYTAVADWRGTDGATASALTVFTFDQITINSLRWTVTATGAPWTGSGRPLVIEANSTSLARINLNSEI